MTRINILILHFMHVRRKKPQIYLFEGPFFTKYVNPNDEQTYQKIILLTKKLTNKHTVTVIIGESRKGRAYTEKGVHYGNCDDLLAHNANEKETKVLRI